MSQFLKHVNGPGFARLGQWRSTFQQALVNGTQLLSLEACIGRLFGAGIRDQAGVGLRVPKPRNVLFVSQSVVVGLGHGFEMVKQIGGRGQARHTRGNVGQCASIGLRILLFGGAIGERGPTLELVSEHHANHVGQVRILWVRGQA